GIALCGGMLLPWAVGKTANIWGIGTGLSIAIFDALAIFVLQLTATRFRSVSSAYVQPRN
ncbi:MAG: hypothetical protein ACRD4G_19145, partial [Bryobacteraceae bacterium]